MARSADWFYVCATPSNISDNFWYILKSLIFSISYCVSAIIIFGVFYFFKYLRESFPCFYWLFLENPQHAFTFWIISPLHYALKSILVLIKPKNYFFEVEESKVYFLFIQIFFSLDLVLAFYYFIRQSNGDEYHLSLYC